MANMVLSINESFHEKTILVIGGTGFIGKVWLSMLLDFIPNIKKIYIMLRPKSKKSPEERFAQSYSQSPVFTHIRNKYGHHYQALNKIHILNGDLTQVNLGLSNEFIDLLKDELDLIVNFAADLRFSAPLDEMLNTNSGGPLNLAKFTNHLNKAKIIHISTCYVAGSADGLVPEQISTTLSPNGTYFSALEEYHWATQESQAARTRLASKEELKRLGITRAQRLGWPNTYTYTKGLGEILLSENLSADRVCIFRPSIVESSEKYPFPGWNEDYNGTAPFIQLISSRFRVLVAKPNHILDVIPVDHVAKALTIAAAALITGTHSQVYQSSTSSLNPLSLGQATHMTYQYYRHLERKKMEGFLFPSPKPRFVSPKHFLSGQNLTRMEKVLSYVVNKIKTDKNAAIILNRTGINKVVQSIKRKAKTIDTIMKIYRPFVYDYNYSFESKNLLKHKINEDLFRYEPNNINWNSYWYEIHLPGLNQWCLPQLKSLTQS